MKSFLKLFFLHPLIILVSLCLIAFFTVSVTDQPIKDLNGDSAFYGYHNIDSYDVCKNLEGAEFVDCFIENNYGLQQVRYKETEGRYPGLIFGSYMNEEVDKFTWNLKDSPEVFKGFVKNPKLFCKGEFKSEEYTANYFLAKYNCNQLEENPENFDYKFRDFTYEFSWKVLSIYLLIISAILAGLAYWFVRFQPIKTELRNKETFAWLSNQKQFRIFLLIASGWMIVSFVVLESLMNFYSFNPFNLYEPAKLWLSYFASIYPLAVLLISYFIVTAEEVK